MPANGFNVGRDVSLTIFTTNGIISTASVKSFEAKPDTQEIKQVLLSGERLADYLPEGWSGSFEYARVDSELDDYFADVEDGYYNGEDLPSGTITETITNVDGTLSQYRYEKVSLKLSDPGSWKGNAEVTQKVDFMASRRRKVL